MAVSHSQMKFGCSECVCIAIESHRPALLKLLLQRSDIMYRDMFWAPSPSNWSRYYPGKLWGYTIPHLHHFGPNSDLSFVGREDCGHMRVDVELQTPFDVLCAPNYSTAFILVSLPLMARSALALVQRVQCGAHSAAVGPIPLLGAAILSHAVRTFI